MRRGRLTGARWCTSLGAQPLAGPSLAKLQAVCPQLATDVGAAGGTSYCCTEEQLDQLQKQIQVASIFLVGCPACNHNFKHFFCLLTCSPDQAAFANVTAAQTANDTGASNAVAEMDYYVAAAFGERFYNSCKDVVYPVMNQKAMTFVGGGAKDYQEWFDFIGLLKDKRFPPVGSPFQMNFPPGPPPEGISPLNSSIPSCGEGALACSCGDCPSAPGCEPPPPPPPPAPAGCPAVGTTSLSCTDVSLAALYVGLLACLPLVVRQSRQQLAESEARRSEQQLQDDEPVAELEVGSSLPRRRSGGGGGGRPEGRLLWEASEAYSTAATAGSGAGKSRGEDGEAGDGSKDEEEEEEEELVEWPATEQLLRQWFFHQGLWCARRPRLVLALSLLAVGACALGLTRFTVMTDPQELWVGPGSQAAREKADYEAAFGPFYRITQLILTTTPAANSSQTTPSGLPAIVTDAHIRLLFDMQDAVDALVANPGGSEADRSSTLASSQKSSGSGIAGGGGGGGGSWNVTLADVCLKPMGADCATQSVLQYWCMSRESFEHGPPGVGVRVTPEFCFTHWSTQCRAAFGGPIDPHLVLGGFPTDSATFRNFSADATAFVVTYPINSHPENREAALAWEAAFVQLASTQLTAMAEGAGLRLSFSTERSVQDELARESTSDAPTVLLSYVVMLLYIAVALGRFPRSSDWRDLLVHSRAALGLGGVLIVAAAVLGALGLCSWAGMRSTLIIAEVIPFLALAVGVDNMMILAAALEQQPASHPLAHRVGLALAAVGPSITLAASCEVVAFSLGGLTSMPALRNFSICAALAVLLDFLLQVTAFVALLALDTRRLEQGRFDCWPWRRARGAPLYDSDFEGMYGGSAGAPLLGDSEADGVDEAQEEVEATFGHAFHAEQPDDSRYVGVSQALRTYMRRVHAPLLRRPAVKAAVLAVFGGIFLLSCACLPRLERGLEQSVALPRDSYLQHYYDDVFASLRVGPPVMFVVQDLNVSEAAPDVSRVCSVAGCDPDSLLNQIAAASRAPWSSRLASPAASWLDDFMTWASPEIPQCCRQFANGTRCPPPDQPPCSTDPDACNECTTCFAPGQMPGGRPGLQEFQDKLPWFLASQPSAACAKGGAGAYSDAIQRNASDPTGVAGLGSRGVVAASSFRASYVVLSRQSDFIGALRASRDFAAAASERLGLRVFPYSIFHIFFEQYLTIGGEALTLLGSACVAIFLICLAATGSPWSATLIILTLCMLLVDIMGAMHLMGIQLNAVSLVNLVMSLGIGVEFCAHLVHAFVEERGPSEDRAAAALGDVGAAVLSGITLTKIAGVAVLAFSRTRIFEIYYFRMYAALVLLGAAHGLILLPVLLAAFGPEELEHWRWKLQRHLRRGQPQRGDRQQRAVALPPQQQQLGSGEAEEGGLTEVQQQLLQAQWAEQQQQGAVLQPPPQLELEQGRPSGNAAAAADV
ncbi:Niemann-Pick C1 [Chlorella sorokiniana]|uniref:Niemann-Pick C1 n=1 Tax=Chlorella sorokiniana TaxID=3076 RepID=A0A2P6TQ90_CHLSO|nr:Niemann-Pick C1 [Chlorella sorokiniana]|eukprot:PRW56197.1 Niemann-Pick C1 [Chlorella sorokiniana]